MNLNRASDTRSSRRPDAQGQAALAFTETEASDPFASENAILDLAENAIRSVVALGFGVQLKARISHFPELLPPPPAAGDSATAEPAASATMFADIDAALALASGISHLDEAARSRRSAHSKSGFEAARDGLARLLASIRRTP